MDIFIFLVALYFFSILIRNGIALYSNEKESFSERIINGISPFHMLLYMIVTFYLWLIIFSIKPIAFNIFLFLFISYSITYYISLSKVKNISFIQSIKNDLPSFALPDINIFHILIFLIIAAPFIFFIGSIIFTIIFEE